MAIFSSLFGTRLHRELGTDDVVNLFTTVRRKAAINEGLERFADLTECDVRWSTIVITGGHREYDLNASSIIGTDYFLRFSPEPVEFHYTDASSHVTIVTGDDLVRRDLVWLNRYEPGWRLSTVASSVMQLPSFYYLRPDGGSLWLGFTPMPSTGSSASAKVLMPYVSTPTPLVNDSDQPFALNGIVRGDLIVYHQAIVHYAAHQLEKLRRDDQASDRQIQKFNSYIAQYLQQRRIKGGRVISQVINYFNRARR